MTTFLLVRHASGDHVGRVLAGRAPGTRLNALGLREAERLAQRLRGRALHAVYASPLERARETAVPLARAFDLPVLDAPGVVELEYGEWTGRVWADLESDRTWAHYNSYRTGTRAPGGELLLEVQARAVTELLRLRERHDGQTVAVVSHADVIRAVVGHFAGIPIELLHRLEISPASVTELELHEWGARVVCVNERVGSEG